MVKPILGIDFGGTLISNKASDLAHYEWFKIMSIMLNDPKIKELAGKEDYFSDVIEIMEKYTGLKADTQENKEILGRWGRSLFSFMSIGSANKLGKDILFKDFAEYLKELKKRFELALISTQPQDSVKPMLASIDLEDFFDYIYESGFYEKPDKFIVLKRFISENGKPLLYIGNSKDDVHACQKLKIPIIIATWDKESLPVEYRKKAECVPFVNNVRELRKILGDEGELIKINPRTP